MRWALGSHLRMEGEGWVFLAAFPGTFQEAGESTPPARRRLCAKLASRGRTKAVLS